MSKTGYAVKVTSVSGIHRYDGNHICLLHNVEGVPYCGISYSGIRQGYNAGVLQKKVADKTYTLNVEDVITFYPDYPEEQDNES